MTPRRWWFAVAIVVPLAALAASSADRAKNTSAHSKNLPDIESTDADEISVQEEINVFSGAAYSNTTIDAGLPGGWNIGASILGLNLGDDGSVPFDPQVYVNVEKVFVWSDTMELLAGTQNGMSLFQQSGGRSWLNYSYVNAQWVVNGVGLRGGGYFANRAMTGTRDEVGYLLGFTVPIPLGGLALSGDLISGRSAVSFATLQFLLPLPNRLEVGLGVQLPMPHSGNDYSAVLELNWN